MVFGATINPIDLVLSQQGNDLRLALHGSTDRLTIQSWYTGTAAQTEILRAGNGPPLLNTQVAQLIQAMATFSAQTGLTWDQASISNRKRCRTSSRPAGNRSRFVTGGQLALS